MATTQLKKEAARLADPDCLAHQVKANLLGLAAAGLLTRALTALLSLAFMRLFMLVQLVYRTQNFAAFFALDLLRSLLLLFHRDFTSSPLRHSRKRVRPASAR